jgi:hypothetical protein
MSCYLHDRGRRHLFELGSPSILLAKGFRAYVYRFHSGDLLVWFPSRDTFANQSASEGRIPTILYGFFIGRLYHLAWRKPFQARKSKQAAHLHSACSPTGLAHNYQVRGQRRCNNNVCIEKLNAARSKQSTDIRPAFFLRTGYHFAVDDFRCMSSSTRARISGLGLFKIAVSVSRSQSIALASLPEPVQHVLPKRLSVVKYSVRTESLHL